MHPAVTETGAAPSRVALTNAALLKAGMISGKTKKTALESALNENRVALLVSHCKRRFDAYHGSLSGWRQKLDKYMKSAEDFFDWRKGEGGKDGEPETIFDRQNDSINLVGAFAEYFYAQTVQEIFGTEPWFAVAPEGKSDRKLADDMTAHLSWKLAPTNITPAYKETAFLATILGTCFTKKVWHTETDFWEESCQCLHDTTTGEPVNTSTGDLIRETDEITEEQVAPDEFAEVSGVAPAPGIKRYPKKDPATDLSEGEYHYAPRREPKSRAVSNVKAYNLHYRDIAFDPTAPELTLSNTGFYHRFERGLLDIIQDYNLDSTMAQRLLYEAASGKVESTQQEDHRGESKTSKIADESDDKSLPNVMITLVEGYERLDITGTGKPSCVYVVFIPSMEMMLHCDYLSAVCPEGMLPVRAHTINRVPWRIVGRGYFEKFAETQRQVDTLYNRIVYHDRKCANPITALDKSLLELEEEEENFDYNPDKPLNLKAGADLNKALQFKTLPDMSNRTVVMMNTVIQMVQMRTGITSASQGDVSGVPEANTATGVKQLISRAAVLLKNGVGDLRKSISEDLYYVAALVYANQDEDETFTYGEGDNTSLIELKAADVKGIRINVKILLSQSQNQFKLEHAQAGIGILQSYIALPEAEKAGARPLFIQAMRALEFSDAEAMIRQSVTDLMSGVMLLPVEQQMQAVQIVQAGYAALGAPPPPPPPELAENMGNVPTQ